MYNIRIKIIPHLEDAKKELAKIGVDSYGVDVMAPKCVHIPIELEHVEIKIQEMLSIGGEAAVSRGAINLAVKETDVLLIGTLKHYSELVEKLKNQPFGLSNLGKEINKTLENFSKVKGSIKCGKLKCGKFDLKLGEKTLVMGILNTTPDSFYDGGKYTNLDKAIEHALAMEKEGADIIDVGGESSRPGSEPVPLEVELERVIPVIKEISSKVKIPISIDTVKAKVAVKALDAGASIINDISGLRFDPEMAKTAAQYDAPVVIMHMKGTPKDMQNNPEYNSVMGEIISFLRQQTEYAINTGINQDKIIIDPGIGFGKKLEHNLEIIRNAGELKTLGFPILAGPSRKSFIGNILNNQPPEERLEGTIASAVVLALNGVDILRVHDVEKIKKALKVVDKIKNL